MYYIFYITRLIDLSVTNIKLLELDLSMNNSTLHSNEAVTHSCIYHSTPEDTHVREQSLNVYHSHMFIYYFVNILNYIFSDYSNVRFDVIIAEIFVFNFIKTEMSILFEYCATA